MKVELYGKKDAKGMIKFVTVTELARKTTAMISEIERTGELIIITKKGKPVATLKKFEDSNLKG